MLGPGKVREDATEIRSRVTCHRGSRNSATESIGGRGDVAVMKTTRMFTALLSVRD